MKTAKFLTRQLLLIFIIAFTAALFIGCQEDMSVEPTNSEPTTDKEALQQITDEDSLLSSFEPNYTEDEGMDFLGKVSTEVFPYKVWQKMRLVNRNLNIEFEGDTAYGTLTKTFEGVLFIAVSYDSTASQPDTIITKPFSTVVTRKIVYIKIGNSDFPKRNWVIAAVSLPEGGTLSPNIDLQKLTIFLPNGDTMMISSPNEYFLKRRMGWWRQIPIVRHGQQVLLRVELFSAYEENDFVTLTYGANRLGHHRAKRRFELISSTPVSGGYEKVYEQTYTAHQWPGFYHAIINAMPRQVVFDDSTPVEAEAWGVPYFVSP